MMKTQTLTNNEICTKITNIIYSTCKSNKKTSTTTAESTLNNQNCSSQHYFAIAQANFRRYQQLLLEGRDINEYLTYLNTWVEAEKLAKEHKEEEMNTRVNKNWISCKHDGRSLWRAIDWKGKNVKEKTEEIPADVIQSYFRGIFQSQKNKNNKTLVKGETYECEWVEVLIMTLQWKSSTKQWMR